MGNDLSAVFISSFEQEEDSKQRSTSAKTDRCRDLYYSRDDNNNNNNNNNHLMMMREEEEELLLDWSNKQSRILTANGKANDYFTTDKYVESECPHYHLQRAESRATTTATMKNHSNGNYANEVDNYHKQRKRYWKDWISSIIIDTKGNSNNGSNDNNNNNNNNNNMIVCGAWYRSLFAGEWEHTTDHDEYTFNLQTNTLFIDLRIPKLADKLLPAVISYDSITTDQERNNSSSSSVFQYLSQMSPRQLRLYARRHVFAGFTIPSSYNQNMLACTRHHIVDWNYVGQARPRPNKWYVDTGDVSTDRRRNDSNANDDELQVWKEYSFVTNPNNGQYYYMEKWQRLSSDTNNNTHEGTETHRRLLALISQDYKSMLIIIGNHFNYVWGRSSNTLSLQQQKQDHYRNMLSSSSSLSLVGLVDIALKMGDRDTAELFLSMDAGHGKIFQSDGGYEFVIDHAIAYWRNNTNLFSKDNNITIHGTTIENCTILWNDTVFTIVESSFTNLQQLRSLFFTPPPNSFQTKEHPNQLAFHSSKL